jgi:hypothetical protein
MFDGIVAAQAELLALFTTKAPAPAARKRTAARSTARREAL